MKARFRVLGLAEGHIRPQAILEWAVRADTGQYELARRQTRALVGQLAVPAHGRGGMVAGVSMALLSGARHGGSARGGLSPRLLLTVGPGASLAADVAVDSSAVWSRMVHVWLAFVLMSAYGLLLGGFHGSGRGRVRCVRRWWAG